MKRWMASILCLVLLVFAAACGNGASNDASNKAVDNSSTAVVEEKKEPEQAKAPEEKVKLRIYAQYADEDTKTPYDYAVAELAKEFPNVELELEIQAQDDGQKLKTLAATGNLPDIFQAGMDIITTLSKSNNILVLDDYLDKVGFKEKMHKSALNTLYTDDGHVYAFPYAGNELILWFYNKELFTKYNVKVPETYEELKQAAEVFNENGIIPLALFAKEKWPDVALFDVFATRIDPKGILSMDRDGEKMDKFQSAADALIEQVKAGLLPKGVTNLNYDQAAALFHEGKAAMFLNGQWEIAAATESLGDNADWMYYPAPTKVAYEANKYAFSGGGGPGGYAVSANSKHTDLAVEVASFISLKYAEYKYTHRGNPIVATTTDKEIVVPYPAMMTKLAETIPNITSTTAFAWGIANPKFKAAIEDASQSLMTGAYSSSQFVKDVNFGLE